MTIRKSMGGIVIDIWEKSNFWGAFGSQKGAKNTIFAQGGGGFKNNVKNVYFRASDSVWNFTLSMIEKKVIEEGTGNSLFSPVSILTTINMLLLGTTGETRDEIIQALGEQISLSIFMTFCTS